MRCNRPFAAIAVIAAGLAQSVAFGHFFRADDFLHLYQIADLGLLRFALNTHGGHLLVTSNTIFYVWHAIFGLHPEPYYLLAVATHLLNALLLFRIVELSCARSGIALAAALLWGTSSLVQGSVGWFSVHGQLLVATWTLWWLYDLARVERDARAPARKDLVRWYLLMLAAATSFGTGIPIAMLSGPVTYLLLPDSVQRRPAALVLSTLLIVVPCLYFGCNWILVQMVGDPTPLSHAAWQLGFLLHPADWLSIFSLLTRLLSYGIASLLTGPLLIIGADGNPLGPLASVPLHVVSEASFAIAAAAVAAVIASGRRSPAPMRRRLLGYAMLLVGSYAMIAVGRASVFERFAYPLSRAASEPRYHYVAGALIAAIVLLAAAQWRPSRGVRVVAAAWLVAVVASAGAATRTVNESLLPKDGLEAYRRAIAAMEREVESRPPGSVVRLDNRPFPEAGLLNQGAAIGPANLPLAVARFHDQARFPGWAALFIITYPDDELEGRRVRFVVRNKAALEATRRWGGARIEDLLVGPDDR